MRRPVRLGLAATLAALALGLPAPARGAPEPGARPGARWANLEDVVPMTAGVFTGTIHDGYVSSRYPKARILRFSSPADMILSLRHGTVDVAFFDTISARVVLKGNPDLGVLAGGIHPTNLGVGFAKRDPALRDAFNAFLRRIRADGTFRQMHERWLENDPEKAEMPVIDTSAGTRRAVLAVSVADLPYVAQMGQRYVGFDVELVQRFARDQGLRLVIENLDFSALVAALATGKADLIADGISITEERLKQIDFSDPYLTSTTSVLAMRRNLAGAREERAAPPKAPSFLEGVARSFRANLLHEQRYLLIVDGLKTTVLISLASTVLGTLLGALVCALRMSGRRLAELAARAYITVLRGTPVLVLLMLIFYVVFASVSVEPVVVASIAFGMNFAAYVAEMFRVGIEAVDRGQTEAGVALGFTRTATFVHIVLPQALRHVLPVYKGEFISLVKMTSIVGYIAVQDLTKASDIIRSRTFDAFFPLLMVAALYFLISWLLASALSLVELRIDPRRKRRAEAGR